jgi:hypothetical protein
MEVRKQMSAFQIIAFAGANADKLKRMCSSKYLPFAIGNIVVDGISYVSTHP